MDSVVSEADRLAPHVEATSLLVAASRAVEARKQSPLVVDALAEIFVKAADGGWAQVFRDPGPIDDFLGAGEFGRDFVNYQGARTVLFDRFINDAVAAGIKQFVILAAGLDSRGFRLDWPQDAVLYELDRPGVLEFKAAVLDASSVQQSATRIAVSADLAGDWPTALSERGFDPSLPTAWLVEGLLMYLSAEAEFELLDRLVRLSPAGSRIALEHTDAADAVPDNPDGSPQGAEMRDLIRNEKRPDPVAWFAERVWRTQSIGSKELLSGLGRPLTYEVLTPLQTGVFVEASHEAE